MYSGTVLMHKFPYSWKSTNSVDFSAKTFYSFVFCILDVAFKFISNHGYLKGRIKCFTKMLTETYHKSNVYNVHQSSNQQRS